MIEDVFKYDFTPAPLPAKFEAGTPNISGVIGFGVAIQYLQKIGMDKIQKLEKELTAYCIRKLDEFGDIRQYGPRDMAIRGGICSFTFEKIHPHDVATILDEENIAIRGGHHCSKLFMQHHGITGTNRASFYFYNTKDDVDHLVDGLKRVVEVFKNE